MGPELILSEAFLVVRERDKEGLRVPAIRIAAMWVVQNLPADTFEEGVTLPRLLHSILEIPTAVGPVHP